MLKQLLLGCSKYRNWQLHAQGKERCGLLSFLWHIRVLNLYWTLSNVQQSCLHILFIPRDSATTISFTANWAVSLPFPRLLRLHPLGWLMFYLGYLPSDKQSKHWDWCDQRTCLHIFKTFEVVITLSKGCSYGRLLEPQKIGALYPWIADGRLKLTSGSSCQTPGLFLVDESCSQQLDGVTVSYTFHCWTEPLCLWDSLNLSEPLSLSVSCFSTHVHVWKHNIPIINYN